MLKYAHIRNKDDRGNFLNGGSFTIAFEEIEEQHGGFTVTYAISHCNPKDNFCKKIGRDIANGRYLRDQVGSIMYNGEKPNLKTIVNSIAETEKSKWENKMLARIFNRMTQKGELDIWC